MSQLEARARWSLAARCPRAGALGLLGAEPAEPDERMQRYWRRGKLLGQLVADQLAERHGEENIVREKAVAWPGGIGHVDVFIKTDGLPVEVKSRTSLHIEDADLLQLAGYTHFDPDANSHGALIVIDPNDLEERAVPLILTDEWRDRVEEVAADVVRAGKTGALPDCVCSTPRECRNNFCPFTDSAWEGWAPPDPIQVAGEVAELATELFLTEQQLKAKKEEAEEVTDARDELRARIAELTEPDVDYVAGGIRLRRTTVAPAPSIDARTAIKAGVVTEELLAPFLKPRAAYERWNLAQDGDLVHADPGEVPF